MKRGPLVGGHLCQLELELRVDRQGLGGEGGERRGEFLALRRVGQDDLRLVGEQAHRSQRLLLLGGEPQRRDGLGRLEGFQDALEDRQLLGLGLPVGPGLLEARLQAFDAVGHDAQVGEEQFLAERGQLGRGVGAGECPQDDQEGVALADQGEPLRVIAVRARHQAGRVEHLDRGGGHLLRLVERGEEVEPGVGERRDPHLAGMHLAGVGRGPGQ